MGCLATFFHAATSVRLSITRWFTKERSSWYRRTKQEYLSPGFTDEETMELMCRSDDEEFEDDPEANAKEVDFAYLVPVRGEYVD